MATTNKVKGWTGVLMTEDSSSHWPIKRRYVYYETSRRAGLEFVCIFGHDGLERTALPTSWGRIGPECLNLTAMAPPAWAEVIGE